jgi:hypothetical protein
MPRSGATFGAQETVALPVQSSVVSPVTRDELTMYFSLGDTVGSLAEPSWISRDGCRLYLTYTQASGKPTIYVATRPR